MKKFCKELEFSGLPQKNAYKNPEQLKLLYLLERRKFIKNMLTNQVKLNVLRR